MAARAIGVLLLAATAPVLAASGPTPDLIDGVFYTFGIAGMLFYATIILIIGPPRFLSFAVFSALMLLLWSTLDGTLTHLLGGDQTFADSAPLLAAGLLGGYGYLQAALTIERPHRLTVLKPWLCLLGVCCLVIPLGLPFFSYFALYLPMNVLILAMLVAQTLPPLTWRHLSPTQHRWALFTPIAMAVATLAIYGAHFAVIGFSRPELDIINRGLFLSYLTFSLATATANVLAIARDKENAEKASLLADKREAEAQVALAAAERRYAGARDAAAERARQLASASHDLKQPITALRSALKQMAAEPGGRVSQMLEAVDYLEQLAGTYATDSSLEAAYGETDGAQAASAEAVETVPLTLVLGTVQRMFAREAQQRGVALRTVDSSVQVVVAPLVLMRMLSNLVANALNHGQPTRLLIGVRRRAGDAAVQVLDDGTGMSPEELAAYLQPQMKRDASDGDGLGLAIVQELAESRGYGFDMRSVAGRGTRAEIRVRRHPTSGAAGTRTRLSEETRRQV